MLSVTTDYVQSHGDPQPYLRRIAEAGFSHVHWCHEWASDRLYTPEEVAQIEAWLKAYGLRLLNLHASQGQQRFWVAQEEPRRLAGLELVRNRLQMSARLGGQVAILHIPSTAPPEARPGWMDAIRKSLDDLQPYARQQGVRIALENMAGDDFQMIAALLSAYEPGYLGLCYDSGHALLGGDGLSQLERLKERLIAVHLHDNDGVSDQHKIPFTGSLDWERLMPVIAASAYRQCINLEVIITDSGLQDEAEFLRQSYQAGERLERMLTGA